MTEEAIPPVSDAVTAAVFEPESFDLEAVPVEHPIELFELSFPLPPQGTWRDKFDIRADVRFAYMDLTFDPVTVRVSVRGARLSSSCLGCSLLPHSLYGLNPLPSRNILAVQEKQTVQIGASAAAQVQSKAGVLQGFDASASLEAKASGEAARHLEREGKREESVPRVVPRPHGAWDLTEPHKQDGCLDGDYLTSRGQYREEPSDDPTDLPLATVQADVQTDNIEIELSIEILPTDLKFHKISSESSESHAPRWFKRNAINTEIIARRLVELAHGLAGPSETPIQSRIKLGSATLRGKRRRTPRS